MLPTDTLDYHLPDRLIATHPASPRDDSRLMVVSRTDTALLEHRRFRDLPSYLRPTDVLVRNRSAVLPARLAGRRTDSGGRVQGLFLDDPQPHLWRVLLKSNGKLRAGTELALHHPDRPDDDTDLRITLVERDEEAWLVRPSDDRPPLEQLSIVGATPLPPYILSARKQAQDATPDERDRVDYQTVYADSDDAHSVAAPTAGLHFTPELESRLDQAGIARAEVVLHVGTGTFAPVNSEHVEDHPIHTERASVPAATIDAIARARAADGRCICVGTTTVRALESVPPHAGALDGTTNILITPGYAYRNTDALITNFHLPRSTLLAMVSALFHHDDPVRRLLDLYNTAIDEGYRFYSFGDAMLILP